MILLIDNYDSFVYNLYQAVGAVRRDIRIIRNDKITVAEIERLKPEKIILSPGPGKPGDAGICLEAVQEVAGKVPILGVCLGHQVIYEAYGGRVTYAKQQMHGKTSKIKIVRSSALFKGLPTELEVGRYHSLAAAPDTIPEELEISAVSADDEIMAVKHKKYPVYGVQFHPESILTPDGQTIITNFLDL